MKDKNFSEQEIKRKVFSFIEERKLIQEGDRVIAGISGGADSVCLFWMLLAYRSGALFLLPWRISIMVSGKKQRRMRIL